MLKIAICDREQATARQLGVRIRNYMGNCEIRLFASGKELLLLKEDFDIYFLDMQTAPGNGIETAKKLRRLRRDCLLIFLSDRKDYVFEAFDVAALHYLIKPVEEEKLREALKRALRELEVNRSGRKKQFLIKNGNRNMTVNIEDIFYFENDMRKIIAHTNKGNIAFYGTMAEVEAEAGEEFYRCHRGYLVNLFYVAEFDADSILLSNGETIYLSKNRHHDFLRQYDRYLKHIS